MSRSIVLTVYWSGEHVSYRNKLHDGVTDEDLGQVQPRVLQELLEESGAVDGDEIEIVVRKTGQRPFGDRKVRLIRPHTYERESSTAGAGSRPLGEEE